MAARLLMRYLITRVYDTEGDAEPKIDMGALRYFADAFQRYLDGRDGLESSLGISRRRGNAPLDAVTPHTAQDAVAPQSVQEFYTAEVFKGKRGAIDRTARAFGISRGRVRYLLYEKT